jgi:hypothetical protein
MIYRKAKNAKVFYALDEAKGIVCRVIIKNYGYELLRSRNPVIQCDAEDERMTEEITESDFLSAYKIAKTGTDIEVTFI